MKILKEILVPKKVFDTDKIKVGMECLLCLDYSYGTNTYNYAYHCTVDNIAWDGVIIELKEKEPHMNYISDELRFRKHYIKPEEVGFKNKYYIEFDKEKWDKFIKEADFVDGRDTWYDD